MVRFYANLPLHTLVKGFKSRPLLSRVSRFVIKSSVRNLIHCHSALQLIYMQNVKQMPYAIHIYGQARPRKIYYGFLHPGVRAPRLDDLYFLSAANAKLIKKRCDY